MQVGTTGNGLHAHRRRYLFRATTDSSISESHGAGIESASILYRFFSHTHDAVFAINDTRHIVFQNSAFSRMLQRPTAQASGRLCHEVLCGRSLSDQHFCDPNCRVARDTARGRAVENFDLVVSKPDKQVLWLSIGGYALPQRAHRRLKLRRQTTHSPYQNQSNPISWRVFSPVPVVAKEKTNLSLNAP